MIKQMVAALGLICLAFPAWAEPMRTVEVTADKAAAGGKLFQLCTPCHGVQGKARAPRAALLTSKTFLAAASDKMIISTITNGRPGTAMTGWANVLKPEQIEEIVSFLRTETKVDAAKLNEGPLTGDAGEGAKLFMRSCVQCHNMRGGHREWGTGILRRPFLNNVTNGYLRYMIKNGKAGTSMQAFANGPLPELTLTPEQVEHVVAFLRSLP
jgi:mono/diheme cytochrome c family protein